MGASVDFGNYSMPSFQPVSLPAVQLPMLGGQNLVLPLLSVARFAELVGLSEACVASAVDRGYWPVIRVGKRRFVNMVAVYAMCADKVPT